MPATAESNLLNINLDEIIETERILLPAGKSFDAERRRFIKNFETIDLQAVPGSGKTTALLAKLLILEKRLPLNNNRGVLILSHTNTAVDEIKNNIGIHCPKLFSYPNFIGTVQSFVDQFLAIPYYENHYKKKVIRIDNEIYDDTIEKFLTRNLKGFSFDENKNAKYFIRSNEGILKNYRFEYINGILKITKGLNKEELTITKPRRNSRNWVDFSNNEKNRIRQWLKKAKLDTLSDGILHYDDAYFLANIFLSKFPKIKNILQKKISIHLY